MKKMLMGFVAMLALIAVNTAHADEDPNDSRTSSVASSGSTCPLINSSSVGRDDSSAPSDSSSSGSTRGNSVTH